MHLNYSIAAVLFLTAHAVAADSPPKNIDSSASIKSGLTYLDEYGANWMESRKCASCHHLAQTVWVLSEAKAAGFKVDEKFLGEVAAFLAAPDGRARIFPDPNDKRPENQQLSGGAVYALFGIAALEKPSKEIRELQARAIKHIIEKQEKDGSWPAGSAGPMAPVFDEKATASALIALSLSTFESKDSETVKAAWTKTSKWLGERKGDAAELQFHVLKLWLQVKAGDTVGAKASLVTVFAKQNNDGGWSQRKDAESDAWATGQALYVLSLAGRKPEDPAILKARAFLVKSQLADGSWIVKSRPRSNAPKGAKNLEPITYASTSWALLGLIRSSPKSQ